MSQLHLHGHTYSFEEIQSDEKYSTSEDLALHLAYKWLNHEQNFVFKTSGSTGVPKQITFNRNQIRASIHGTQEALGLSEGDHLFCSLSMQSIAGAMMLLRALELNIEITIVEPSSVPLDQLTLNHPYTIASFVPLQLNDVVAHREQLQKLNGFKTILVGGGAMNAHLETLLSNLQVRVFETYGMTETLTHIALRELGKQDFFKVLKGVAIKQDHRGCLCIQAEVTHQEWIVTNDLVEWIDDISFRFLGRADQVINTGGIKVFPNIVERVLSEVIHDRLFFVYGMPHEKWGEAVTLYIEGNEVLDIDMLKKVIGEKLHKFEWPKQIIYKAHFCKTESGKIDRMKTIQANDNE